MIIDCLTKIVYYELVKVIIDVATLVKVIIEIIIYYYSIFKSIVPS